MSRSVAVGMTSVKKDARNVVAPILASVSNCRKADIHTCPAKVEIISCCFHTYFMLYVDNLLILAYNFSMKSAIYFISVCHNVSALNISCKRIYAFFEAIIIFADRLTCKVSLSLDLYLL